MELDAIVPELILAGMVIVLLPLGSFLPTRHKWIATAVALAGLACSAVASARVLGAEPRAVFYGTYAVDGFAVFFKFLAATAAAATLLATSRLFRGMPFEGAVPPLLTLVALGIEGLAASQDLALIAVFLQLVTVPSYVLVGLRKSDRRATEGALKLFLFSAAAGAVMLYGMALLYALTGSLRLGEMASRVAQAPTGAVAVALAFLLVGYGFEATLVPFHGWVPDTYDGAPTAIAGFLSVGPKAAGFAVLLRTAVVALPAEGPWPYWLAAIAAVTMTCGNLAALRQQTAKRLLAWSSLAQAGYLLVGVAAAARSPLGIPAFLVYLAVYVFMTLAAFLAVDAIERQIGSDRIDGLTGLFARVPVPAMVLAIALLSLAGIPPLGGFVGKTLLFGASLGAGQTWLAIAFAGNVALSLFVYLRLLAPMALGPGGPRAATLRSRALRIAMLALATGTVAAGVAPEPWVRIAEASARILGNASAVAQTRK